MQLVGPLLMWTPLVPSKLSISGRRGNAFERYDGSFQSSPLLYNCVVYNLEISHIGLDFQSRECNCNFRHHSIYATS